MGLVARADAVRSSRVQASEPVPPLWVRYLGPTEASRLWTTLDRQLWWTAWHHAGEPVLALPESGEITLFYADALHAQADREAEAGALGVADKGASQACVSALSQGTAVVWTPSALERMTGPLSPLLRSVGHGCLQWMTRGDHLEITGVASDGRLRRNQGRPIHAMGWPRLAPSPLLSASDSLLLELQLPEARWLLDGLLLRSAIKRALSQNYGLDAHHLARLRQLPLRVRIRSSDHPDLQASVELDLAVSDSDAALFEPSLQAIAAALERAGMQSTPRDGSILWTETASVESRVLGGWHQFDHGVWRFSLGEAPRQGEAVVPEREGILRLGLDPSGINQLDWLGAAWPTGFRSSSAAAFDLLPETTGAEGSAQQRFFRVRGQLALF